MPAAIESVPLFPHPTTTSDAVSRIEAHVHWSGDRIAATYILEGDCARIRIPSAGPPRRSDGLWLHTCFEIFLFKQTGTGYFEFNFAPSGEWAMYNFKAYREPASLVEIIAPEIAVRGTLSGFELDASVALPQSFERSAPLCVALATVVEDGAGELSYWALRHPPGSPDFHHRVNFALPLQPSPIAVDRSSVCK